MIGVVGTTVLLISACGGGGGRFASQARPPTAVNVTVYVNDASVSVSPSSLGAGPVVFIVTNQASQSEALTISRAGQSHPLASTAPINPQATTQVSVNFKPGEYTVGIAAHGSTDASLSQPSSMRPASLHIGRERQSSGSELLQP